MIDVEIFNETKRKYLPFKKIMDVANLIFEEYNIKDAKIRIVFIYDNEIKEINNRFLHHNSPTDVLSFNFEEENLEGEIYISIETAEQQAKEYKVSLTNELLRLLIHGILHLLGYEDNTIKKRKIMHNLEDKYLQKILKH
ncbi:MAG TPA: rRNA maturation RNase YbeY [Candidatus Kapabacteria bacterium]|nr:rRNA maturation RNase YbeY [Candidatus Kapabacteria bacterium]